MIIMTLVFVITYYLYNTVFCIAFFNFMALLPWATIFLEIAGAETQYKTKEKRITS